jgi:hypothetical protein
VFRNDFVEKISAEVGGEKMVFSVFSMRTMIDAASFGINFRPRLEESDVVGGNSCQAREPFEETDFSRADCHSHGRINFSAFKKSIIHFAVTSGT